MSETQATWHAKFSFANGDTSYVHEGDGDLQEIMRAARWNATAALGYEPHLVRMVASRLRASVP